MAERFWAINGDFVALHPTGVVRHAREVTLALDALIAEGHPLTEGLALTLVTPRDPRDLKLQRTKVRIVPEYRTPRLPQFWVQAQLPRHAPGGLLSFCNLAPVFHPRHIVCIHDLQTEHTPQSYSWSFRLAHRLILPALGRRARFITTVSTLSRDQLVEFGVGSKDKFAVTYSGADHARRWDANRSRLEVGPRPYLLCLGRNEDHKNLQLMWRIAHQLERMGLDVYLPGDINERTIRSFGAMPANIRILGRVSDDDLAKLYAEATVYALPSRIEGFALTAIEAMIFGCPVVASNAPSMPESCGDAALFAHPDDAEGWVSAVQRLSSDTGLRNLLVAKGHRRAQEFSWRSVALAHLELMARVDRGAEDRRLPVGGEVRASAAE